MAASESIVGYIWFSMPDIPDMSGRMLPSEVSGVWIFGSDQPLIFFSNNLV